MSADHRERIRQAMEARAALEEQASRGRWRQRYHFMAPGGWINDPNGCIHYKGKYHLFYQHNPYGAHWGAMHWGHAVSRDLIHWEHWPIALAPSECYDDHPEGGVFSGSAVESGDKLVVLYTGTARADGAFVQAQCLAVSPDSGRTFSKYAGNPVISPPHGVSPDFRDPKVLRHGDCWYMVLGAALGGGAREGGEGAALLYRSRDLEQWEYRGVLARSGGQLGTMWECPDLFPLNGKWVLIFSPMFCGEQKSVYLVGDMDFAGAAFHPQVRGELDWGWDYYAPQSLEAPDGRRILMAWQNGWDWMPWFLDHGPTAREGWCGSMALPRSIHLDSQNRIVSQPVREVEALRGECSAQYNLAVGEAPQSLPLKDPICFECRLTIDLSRTTAQRFHIDLRAGEEKRTRITWDLVGQELLFDRSQADEGHVKGVRRCDLQLKDPLLEIQIFSDTSSVEVFTDGGLTCMSGTLYPIHSPQKGFLSAEGGSVRVDALELWPLLP